MLSSLPSALPARVSANSRTRLFGRGCSIELCCCGVQSGSRARIGRHHPLRCHGRCRDRLHRWGRSSSACKSPHSLQISRHGYRRSHSCPHRLGEQTVLKSGPFHSVSQHDILEVLRHLPLASCMYTCESNACATGMVQKPGLGFIYAYRRECASGVVNGRFNRKNTGASTCLPLERSSPHLNLLLL